MGKQREAHHKSVSSAGGHLPPLPSFSPRLPLPSGRGQKTEHFVGIAFITIIKRFFTIKTTLIYQMISDLFIYKRD
jgi:hypothetical protein